MFHIWDGFTKDAQPTDEHVYMDWNVGAENPNAPGSVILGTSTVAPKIYADLSDYHYMVVYGEGSTNDKGEVAKPRFMFNRTVENGQQADGGMIEISNKAFDENTGAIVLDLKKDLVRTVPGEEPAADDLPTWLLSRLHGAVRSLFLQSCFTIPFQRNSEVKLLVSRMSM